MGQTILTSSQEKFIQFVIGEERLSRFYLTGGTALAAYHLLHRRSDDLDFFTVETPDVVFLKDFGEKARAALGATELDFQRLHDRNQFLFLWPGEELKAEFTHYPFAQFEEPKVYGGLRVDGVRDIAANKLMAMLDRFEPKDFVDLFFILQTRELEAVRRDAERKFGMKIGNIFLGGELAKVRRIEALPKMLKPLTIAELKAFFAAQAKTLAPEVFKE